MTISLLFLMLFTPADAQYGVKCYSGGQEIYKASNVQNAEFSPAGLLIVRNGNFEIQINADCVLTNACPDSTESWDGYKKFNLGPNPKNGTKLDIPGLSAKVFSYRPYEKTLVLEIADEVVSMGWDARYFSEDLGLKFGWDREYVNGKRNIVVVVEEYVPYKPVLGPEATERPPAP